MQSLINNHNHDFDCRNQNLHKPENNIRHIRSLERFCGEFLEKSLMHHIPHAGALLGMGNHTIESYKSV